MEKTGYIYVLTNESFHRDNWIKIGYAENVEKRVKELSGTALPLPYEVYCTYEIPRIQGVKDPDKLLHDLIMKLNPSLRIIDNREFFEMLPWDAYDMLLAIAQMHGRKDKVKRYGTMKAAPEVQEETEYSIDALFPKGSVVRALYEKMHELMKAIDPSIEEAPRKLYLAFKINGRNILSMWPRSNWTELVLSARIGQITDQNELIYDITNRKWISEQYAMRYTSDTNENFVREIVQQVIALKKK